MICINNIGLDAQLASGPDTMMDYGLIGNTSTMSNWVSDFNDWDSTYNPWFILNDNNTNLFTPPVPMVGQGTLSAMKSLFPWEVHSSSAYPVFVSTNGGFGANSYLNDYHLWPGSPDINSGTNWWSTSTLPGAAFDFYGTPRTNKTIGAVTY